MKKNYFRRNKTNIVLLIFYIVLCFVLMYLDILDLSPKNREFHLNMITTNSIFLGFLFTGLGIMVGFTDKKSVKSLDTAGYMDNYYNSIYMGLVLLVISTIVSSVAIATGIEFISKHIIFIQQISFIGGILFFIKSIFGLMRLIKHIRKENS